MHPTGFSKRIRPTEVSYTHKANESKEVFDEGTGRSLNANGDVRSCLANLTLSKGCKATSLPTDTFWIRH